MEEKEKHIAVIASDLKDFLEWVEETNLDGQVINSKRQLKVGNKTYHCIYKPTHLISLTLDGIIETKNARKGGVHSSIMTIAQSNLKTGRLSIYVE